MRKHSTKYTTMTGDKPRLSDERPEVTRDRSRYWISLGKQIRHGVGVRI
ncbi:hypothetical protein [Dactylosporangium sp. CA-139066]